MNTQRAITQKVGKSELQFMCSARHFMMFNISVKFHENMSSGFKVMERTRKLLTHTHTHTQRKDENYIPPWHTSYAGGIINNIEQEHHKNYRKISYPLLSNVKFPTRYFKCKRSMPVMVHDICHVICYKNDYTYTIHASLINRWYENILKKDWYNCIMTGFDQPYYI